MLDKVDPFTPFYVHEKVTNPQAKLALRAFKRADVEAVDYLTRITRGQHSTVQTSEDWMLVSKLFEFWTRRWTNEWTEFAQTIADIRDTRARKDGYSKEKGRAGVRYLGALPPRLMRLIKIVFPNQQWDREFTEKFTRNIRITKVGEKMDTWFTIPEASPVKNVVEEAVKGLELDNGNTNGESSSSGKGLVRNKKRSTSKRAGRRAQKSVLGVKGNNGSE